MGKVPKLSQRKEQQKAAVISSFCHAIQDNQTWKALFSVNAQKKRIVFKKSLAALNMGPLINLVAKVSSMETVDPLVARYIAGNSMGWAFTKSDGDTKPLQNSPEDIEMIYHEVKSYLVDGKKVTDSFQNAMLFLEYYLQHDWDGLGNDTVAKQENTFKEHFVVVLTEVHTKLGKIQQEGLCNENEKAVERSAFCETITSTEQGENTKFSLRLDQVEKAGSFTDHLKKTGLTQVEALRKMGNKDFSDEQLEEYGAQLQSFDTHKKPPEPLMREVSTMGILRRDLANGVVKLNPLNRLTNPDPINAINASSMQTEVSVKENQDGDGYELQDAHNRLLSDMQSVMTNKMPAGSKTLQVGDCVLNSVGKSQQFTNIWSASQVAHLRQVRESLQKTRQHNLHPIFKLPKRIRVITHLEVMTVVDQRKAIENQKPALPYEKSTKIARMIEQMKDVDDKQQATFIRDTVKRAIMSRNTGFNPQLTSKDPANAADYLQFVLNHLQAQMVYFGLCMPIPPNMWHGEGQPQFDMAEFKDPQINVFTKNWGVLTVVLNIGSRVIAKYAALSPEDKKENKTECGLSLLRFSRLWQPVLTSSFCQETKMLILVLSSIPSRFLRTSRCDSLPGSSQMLCRKMPR